MVLISARILILSCFLFLLSGYYSPIFASGDSNDSLTETANKRANRAALMSAVLPGAGQVMNKKYWKVPLIYATGGVLAYFISVNNTEYKKFKEALIFRTDNDSMTIDAYPRFTVEDLTVRKNYYRRNKDLSIIFVGILYTLNIIDAYVDSQLLDFDVSDDLTMRTDGVLNFLADGTPVASLKLTLTFK